MKLTRDTFFDTLFFFSRTLFFFFPFFLYCQHTEGDSSNTSGDSESEGNYTSGTETSSDERDSMSGDSSEGGGGGGGLAFR